MESAIYTIALSGPASSHEDARQTRRRGSTRRGQPFHHTTLERDDDAFILPFNEMAAPEPEICGVVG